MSRPRLLALILIATSFALTSPGRAGDDPPAGNPALQSAGNTTATANPAGQGTAIVDLDNDGWLDVFVAGAVGQQATPTPPQAMSEYWIGVDGTPPDDALRVQLELPAGQGLLVNQVVDGGPAAKAGLKQFDVLLTASESPLAQIADLAKIIEEKKGATLALRLVRGGKRIIIEVAPERRPASQTGETCPTISKLADEEFARHAWLDLIGTAAEQEEIQRFIAEKREKKRDWLVNRLLRRSTVANKSCITCHATVGDTYKLYQDLSNVYSTAVLLTDLGTERFNINDGHLWTGTTNTLMQVLPWAIADVNQQPLADDVTVTITRKGKDPTRITIRKADRIWEFSEQDDREKLPEEARAILAPYASSFAAALNAYVGNPHRPSLYFTTTGNGHFVDVTSGVNVNHLPAMQGAPASPAKSDAESNAPAVEQPLDRLDRQIESLNSQLEELRRAMQALRQSMKPEPEKPQK
ncbi:MAG: PDZ domain-containing protein [Planctomycetia bacterium]|nr:PDZ domain-containing protein [Planctomycetia bacterium]